MKIELRNSLFVVEISSGKLAQINEINSGVVNLHYVRPDGELVRPAVNLQPEQVRIARVSELAANHGFNDEQLRDFGYVDAAPVEQRAAAAPAAGASEG